MWSPVEKTALAEAEVEYEDVVSTQIDVAFEIVEAPNAPELVGAHAVIWTTTPWTIPVNQALAYGEGIDYHAFELKDGFFASSGAADHKRVTVGAFGKIFAVAEPLVDAFLKRAFPTAVLGDVLPHFAVRGSHLAGALLRHPMHHLGGFFAKPRPMLPGEFVTTDAGTGLVHMAPDHGEDDFLLCKQYGIDPVFAVDGAGMYRPDWPWLGGQGSVINKKFVSADGPICADLRAAGALVAASDDFRHSYPHSWRSKAKVIQRATPQWFIPMDKEEGARDRRLRHYPAWPRARRDRGDAVGAGAVGQPHPQRWSRGGQTGSSAASAPGECRSRSTSNATPASIWSIRPSTPASSRHSRRVGRTRGSPPTTRRCSATITRLPITSRSTTSSTCGSIQAAPTSSPSRRAMALDTRASLYVEGSDQHRGWFQSSLLESCGTSGRAPYDAVLTHGFALDDKGRKMSKSIGNVVDPLKIIGESGADILRLWVASTDYFDDVRIGKEVLSTASDTYRKLRNTFRYLLGALDGWDEGERLPVADMPELERYILHRLAMLDTELKEAANGFEFNRYLRLVTDFAQDELSAFFFDIRKDSLYCDAPADPKRRAYRTVLDTLFHALVRYAAPVLVFTAEETWQARFPSEDGSIHLLEWPELPLHNPDPALAERWQAVRALREQVTEAIEPLRREKTVRSSLEAEVAVPALPLTAEALAEAFIVADVRPGEGLAVERTARHKCGRCWRHLPEVTDDGALCDRCAEVVAHA